MPAGPDAGAPRQSEGKSLDALAAALVGLDPEEDAALSALQADLAAAARGQEGGARASLLDASGRLATALHLRGPARGSLLEEAGHLLEAAMNGGRAAPAPALPAEEEPPRRLPENIDREILASFLSETHENLQAAEAALLSLETNPEDAEAINVVFRAVHTIKGMSSFLEIPLVSDFAHHAETLLCRVRDGKVRFGGAYADLSLRATDMLAALLQAVQDALGGQPLVPPSGYHELLKLLRDCDGPLPGQARIGDILVADGKASRADVELAAASQGGEPLGMALLRSNAASLEDVAQALRKQQSFKGGESAGELFVRVRTDRLDNLIDSIGELVIAQSMVVQDPIVRAGGHHELVRKITHSGKIVRELQDLGMSMRMIPLKATFQKMSRLARDLARKGGKDVELRTTGEDTEIDRNMVDVVDELLMHMVRNAVDHGLEPGEERVRAGKSARGVVSLSSHHSGGSIVFEIQDDGRGLDRERILRKAHERGLLTGGEALSDREVFELIFLPGFSTAEKVTDVSGRGVGMDVVKKGVESLRGSIDIRSEAGKGCRFALKLPLTMAVTDGMLVSVGAQRYILPTLHIQTTLRPTREQVHGVCGGEMVMVSGEALPLIRLHRIFGIPGAVEDPSRALLIVLEDGGRRSALLVDALLHQQQVVAKTLGGRFDRIPGISGGAILGDGLVGLILDPPGLLALSRQGRPEEGRKA